MTTERNLDRQSDSAPQTRPQGATLLIDKPPGWTSFDVVHKVRQVLGVRKAGHAGTLDPMATGLLILCTEGKTKEIDQFSVLDKEYEGTMVLGARTPSFDAETPVIEQRSVEGITEEMIRDAFRHFTGPQTQIPPMWSAVKVKGKRLYTYARKGVAVERKPRSVIVHRFQLCALQMPSVRFQAECSKGTYIRALVEDVGLFLGCGAYLTSLRRTRIGPYRVDDAVTIEHLVSQGTAQA
jgi:tRNA pseudouridine55 synthase